MTGRWLGDARRAKVERKRALAEALCRPPAPSSGSDDVALDELADMVAERIVSRVSTDPEPRQRDERGRRTSLDGGTRQPVPRPPEDHGPWLARIIRERRADLGAGF